MSVPFKTGTALDVSQRTRGQQPRRAAAAAVLTVLASAAETGGAAVLRYIVEVIPWSQEQSQAGRI